MIDNEPNADAICTKFLADMGSGLVCSGLPLPSNTRICRDFRVAVPLLWGNYISVKERKIDPISEELSLEELLKREDELSLKGLGWRDMLETLFGDYWELADKAGKLTSERTLFGDKVAQCWFDWMVEHHFGAAYGAFDYVFSIICGNRLLGETESTIGGVFDRVVMAGGFPCGSESAVHHLKGIHEVPPIVVSWPWEVDPVFD